MTAGAPHGAWNTEETACSIAFLLLQEGRTADKFRTRLEGQRERISILVPTDLRAAQQWMQWIFLSSFPSWKSPTLRARFPGSQFFTNVPTGLE